MAKIDNAIAHNRKDSAEKAERVCKEIERMLEAREIISPYKLAIKMGVSRAFLYRNPNVSACLHRARLLQAESGYIPSRKVVLDSAMDKMIALQRKQIEEKNNEIENLKKECEKLKKALNKKDLKALL